MLKKTNRRPAQPINAGSMADIAFLLLIFFLVTTTIVVDSGIAVRLPPWVPVDPQEIPDRNVLLVKINAHNELFIENQVASTNQIRGIAKDFIMNPTQLPNRPSSPSKAVVSLIHDRGTSYEAYLETYNEIVAAYRELWENEAQRLHGQSYIEINDSKKKAIRKTIPLVISEAEPEDHLAQG